MSTRFNDCLEFVLEREGKEFTNDPLDRGGATKFGVTQATFDKYLEDRKLDNKSVAIIEPEEVADVYETYYWTAGLPQPLDLMVFDAAVQHGTERARKWLQRVLGVKEDGAIGPQTMAALTAQIANGQLPMLEIAYTQIRQSFYNKIVIRDPSQARFQKGWANRMALLKTACETNLA
jgi:lysozyme family protein